MSDPSPARSAATASRSSWPRRFFALGALFVAYVAAGKLGLMLAFANASASPVWPPTGIALAALLLLGDEMWPAILVGAFVVNVTTAGGIATSVGIATGNTLEALAGAYLVRRWAGGARVFERARSVFAFVGLAALVSTAISATIGVTTLALAGLATWADYGTVWMTWWLGDAVGCLLIAPLLLLWIGGSPTARTRDRPVEALGLFASLFLVATVVFGGIVLPGSGRYPLEFLCLPLFVWAAFRLGRREAVTAVLLVASIAVVGTLRGMGPFARADRNISLLLLQSFMGVAALMTLALAVVVHERREVEARLRELSTRDPMTGIANYRHLIAVLEVEIERSRRTERPFAILFLDLDGLKQINDRHGHLVGSRALCRVAEVLDHSSRTIDTAARFGGDEFALVLPEADEAAARYVANRVATRVAGDGEAPAVSVSIGVAVFPMQGDSIEAILGAADRSLYAAKREKTGAPA